MTFLCHVDDIPEGGARGFDIPGRKVFAVKQAGKIFVYVNSCPHVGSELEWEPDDFLDPQGAYIRCSNHGALFSITDGECLQGPCRGQSLQQLPFHVDGTRIVLSTAPQARDD